MRSCGACWRGCDGCGTALLLSVRFCVRLQITGLVLLVFLAFLFKRESRVHCESMLFCMTDGVY